MLGSVAKNARYSYLMVGFLLLTGIFQACDVIAPPPIATQPSPTTGLQTLQSSPTNTQPPTSTAIQPTQIPTTTPRPTSTPTFTPTPPPDFVLQLGAPRTIPNVFRPELGCNWMGIAGQVFGRDEKPALNIVVEVTGNLAGQPLLGLGMTGSAPHYGEGGFEVTLADRPIASQGTLTIVLYDLEGRALTQPIPFDSYDNCDQNLLIMNFSPFGAVSGRLFLPIINQ